MSLFEPNRGQFPGSKISTDSENAMENHRFAGYFILLSYILLIMLLYCPDFPPFSPLHPAPPTPSGNPHTIVRVHGAFVGSSATPFPILYFTSPWLFHNHQFVLLTPLTSSPISQQPLPSLDHQNVLGIHDSVSVLVCLVCFLYSIVDRYVFVAILFFIILMFFSLNKSL